MTDELTPEQEADISRLLAEARHDGPIPADVAARLDAVLGDLSADDLEVFETATVTELAGVRHRRRNAGRLLLAAAAVVVGGVAVGQNLGSTGMDSDDSPSAAEGAADADVPREANGGDTGGSTASGDAEDDQAGEAPVASEYANDAGTQQLLDQLNAPLSLTLENFDAEVQSNLAQAPSARRSAAYSDVNALQAYSAETLFTCPDADYGLGAKLPVYVDEQEAVLVLRRPDAGVQRVDLLECGTAAALASTELPAR